MPNTTENGDVEDFSHRVAAAENVNLRDRLARLESSMATWASDLDSAHAESTRLRSEIESLRAKARASEDAKLAAEAERMRLFEAVSLRDSHIADLEARIVSYDMGDVESRRTRSRLHAIRRRLRAKQAVQADEIASLRRMLSLGHASRQQLEEELAELRMDAERNTRYLDKLERRLEAAEARVAGFRPPEGNGKRL